MTTETILTDERLIEIAANELQEHFDRLPNSIFLFARAIEKAVLQSEQVQEWKRDAERYRWLKKQFRIMSLDMGGNHTWVLQRPLREGCSIDAVCDTSMEKQQ